MGYVENIEIGSEFCVIRDVGAVHAFNTLDELKQSDGVKSNEYVYVNGYANIHDQGGSFWFVMDEAVKASLAQEYKITVPLNSGLYAGMVTPSYVTPTMFGAVYDNSADSTAEANTTALQNAVNFACTNRIPLVLDGNLYIYSTVEANSHLHMYSKGYKLICRRYGSETFGLDDLFGYTLITATDKEDLIFDGVFFENSGHSIYDAKAEEIQGGVRTFLGYGSCLGIARCSDVTVRNCHFFKGGGYGHYSASTAKWDFVGSALWISCCHDVIIAENIVECSHNGIMCDRWFRDTNNTVYNYNITITGNLIHSCSGDAIDYEGSGQAYNIVISNNTAYNIRRRFIAIGRGWGMTINGNTFSNAPELRQKPTDEYGLSGIGYEAWDISTIAYPAITLRSGYIRDVIISNNVLKYATDGIQVSSGYDIAVIGNEFLNINDYCVILHGAADTDATKYGSFTVTGNNFASGSVGVHVSNSDYDNIELEHVTITGNTSKAERLAYITHAAGVAIEGNSGNAPCHADHTDGLKLSGRCEAITDSTYNVLIGDVLYECDNVELDVSESGGDYGIALLACEDVTGHIMTDAGAAVIYTTGTANATGHLEVYYKGEEPSHWMANGTDNMTLDIISASVPTVGRCGQGSTWKRGGDGETPTTGTVLSAVYYGSAWHAVHTIGA